MKTIKMLGVPSMLALALGLTACSSSFSVICEKQQECSGGNDMDVNACVVQGDTLGQIAAAYDCSDQFSKAVECYEAKGTCKNGHFSADCDDEGKALTSCQAAASATKGKTFSVQVTSAACVKYQSEALKCCDKISDADAKQSCQDSLESIVAYGTQDACEAALNAIGNSCD